MDMICDPNETGLGPQFDPIQESRGKGRENFTLSSRPVTANTWTQLVKRPYADTFDIVHTQAAQFTNIKAMPIP